MGVPMAGHLKSAGHRVHSYDKRGGGAADFKRARRVLARLGRDIFHVGPLGAGHAVKALNNYLGAAGTLAGFEALLLARALGLEPQPVLDAINASTGHNYTTERK